MKHKTLINYKVGSFLDIKKRSLENQRLYCGGYLQPKKGGFINSLKSFFNLIRGK